MWSCGTTTGEAAYAALKTKKLEAKHYGSDANADKGRHSIIASELAAADPHAAHAAIYYSPQARVDWAISAHLSEETKPLAAAVDRAPRACYVPCLGAGPLDPSGLSQSQGD